MSNQAFPARRHFLTSAAFGVLGALPFGRNLGADSRQTDGPKDE